MKQCCVLLALLAFICAAVYGQAEEGASQSAAFQFDHDQLLARLATLKPFKPDHGESEAGYAFVVTREDFQSSLIFLSEGKIDEVMDDFIHAVAFSFNANTQFLMLTQWKDQEAAQDFMQIEDTSWRLKDEKYEQYIVKVEYSEIEVAKDEKALLTRKTLKQAGQKQDVTIVVSARKEYLFECTLMGTYQNDEVKKLVSHIWKIIESEAKKQTR